MLFMQDIISITKYYHRNLPELTKFILYLSIAIAAKTYQKNGERLGE